MQRWTAYGKLVNGISRSFNLSGVPISALLILNKSNVRLIEPHFRMELIKADPDDNKFVDCAFAAGADYLVTEDNHFNILKKTAFPKLNLVTLDEFMETRLVKGV